MDPVAAKGLMISNFWDFCGPGDKDRKDEDKILVVKDIKKCSLLCVSSQIKSLTNTNTKLYWLNVQV